MDRWYPDKIMVGGIDAYNEMARNRLFQDIAATNSSQDQRQQADRRHPSEPRSVWARRICSATSPR
jgi:hypothetical protein